MNDFDLIVIGAGTGGLVSSVVAAKLGAKTLLIERERMGGECLWTGCVPSKTLIRSAKIFDWLGRSEEFGIHIEKPRLIWNALKLRIQDVRDEIRRRERAEFDRSGVEFRRGTAAFIDQSTLRLQSEGGEQTLRAAKFIVATGSVARLPDVPGLSDCGAITHREIFNLPAFPRSLTILGGGPIGCEFAQAFARLGSKVTLVQSRDRLLAREEVEVSEAARKILQNSGVEVLLSAHATGARADADAKYLDVEIGGATRTLRASQLLIATGKRPDLEALNLAAAGVMSNGRGILVDAHLRTTAPNIWACGDVTGGDLFTHAAEYGAKIAAQNALLPLKAKYDARALPWTTFLDPEIARVGLTEAQARLKYARIKVFQQRFADLDRAIIDGESEGFLKVVCSGSGRILGAHLVGPSAGELIHAWSAAVRDGALIGEFAERIHVYPTLSEIHHRAGNDAYAELLEAPMVQWAPVQWALKKWRA